MSTLTNKLSELKKQFRTQTKYFYDYYEVLISFNKRFKRFPFIVFKLKNVFFITVLNNIKFLLRFVLKLLVFY